MSNAICIYQHDRLRRLAPRSVLCPRSYQFISCVISNPVILVELACKAENLGYSLIYIMPKVEE